MASLDGGCAAGWAWPATGCAVDGLAALCGCDVRAFAKLERRPETMLREPALVAVGFLASPERVVRSRLGAADRVWAVVLEALALEDDLLAAGLERAGAALRTLLAELERVVVAMLSA